MPTYIPKKGDYVAVTFDPQSGHEQMGRRPALVVSNDLFNRHTGLAIVCPITNTRRGYPFHVVIPDTFYNEGKQYLKDCGHRGKVTELSSGVQKLLPGVASYKFDVPIICRVFGEQDMYFNVKDRGLVSVTGCCHQGIIC